MSYRNQVIPDDVDVQEFTATYLSDAFELSQSRITKSGMKPIMILTKRMRLVCQTFYLNNYEVNLILESYLNLWSKKKTQNYILLTDLLSEFDTLYYALIKKIFKEEEVYYDVYFESFVILLFCNFNQIISYLLTMMNINSNIMINEEQIDRVLDVFDRQYINVFDFKDNAHNRIYLNECDAYSIKLFIPWLISCLGFQSLIFGVRNVIVDLTLGNSSFNNITKRIDHYYSMIKSNFVKCDGNNSFMCNKLIATQLPSPPPLSPLNSNPSTAKNSFVITTNSNSPDKIQYCSSNTNVKLKPSKPPVMPKEACLSKVKRIVFSNEPPQYYYDYYLLYPSINSINDLILELRSDKGYGLRNRSSTNSCKRNCFRSKVKTMCYYSCNKKINNQPDNKVVLLNNRNMKNSRVKSCNFNTSSISSLQLNLADTPNTVQLLPRQYNPQKVQDNSKSKCDNNNNVEKINTNLNTPISKLRFQYSF